MKMCYAYNKKVKKKPQKKKKYQIRKSLEHLEKKKKRILKALGNIGCGHHQA